MSRYRVETVHGRHLLCGGILPADAVQPGQLWCSSSGNTVKVTRIGGDWVEYEWYEDGVRRTHEKLNFAFQCRYCLVLDEPIIPKEFA